MSCEKLPYEKPEISFWDADELDAIEATMSGYGGGGYVPPEPSDPSNSAKSPRVVSVNWSWESVTTKNQYWFMINDSGVHTIEISVDAGSSLLIYSKSPVNGKTKLVDQTMSSGSKATRIETDYRSSTLVCVKPSKRATIKCRAQRFVYNIPKSKIGDCGVEWKPAKALYRPDESELCLSRWYIAEAYVASIIKIFDDKATKTLASTVTTGGLESALRKYIIENIPKLASKASPISTIVVNIIGAELGEPFRELGDGIHMCATENTKKDVRHGVLVCVDQHIDLSGGSTVQLPNFGFVKWDGGVPCGAAGYDNGTTTAV